MFMRQQSGQKLARFIVATPDQKIIDVVKKFGGKAILTLIKIMRQGLIGFLRYLKIL